MAVHNGFKSWLQILTQMQRHALNVNTYRGSPGSFKTLFMGARKQTFFSFYGICKLYTASVFDKRDEILKSCCPYEALRYLRSIEPRTMFCNRAEIEEKVLLRQVHPVLKAEDTPMRALRDSGITKVNLFLLTKSGDVGFGSGINWGHRRNKIPREPNQAYIPLPSDIARSGFFPLEGRHFSVLTDDKIQMIMRVEQQNNKAITTPQNNSLIGEYLRGRIGVASGAFVLRQDLLNYGRTDVTFYKLDEEEFLWIFCLASLNGPCWTHCINNIIVYNLR